MNDKDIQCINTCINALVKLDFNFQGLVIDVTNTAIEIFVNNNISHSLAVWEAMNTHKLMHS